MRRSPGTSGATVPNSRMSSIFHELEQLSGSSFIETTKWMRSQDVKERACQLMNDLGVDMQVRPQTVLTGFLMAMDADNFFTESDNDAIMRREASRFTTHIRNAFEGRSMHETTSLNGTVERFVRFFNSWRASDIPDTIDNLTASVVAHGIRERENGVAEPNAPEEILSQIRLLSPEAEQEARRRFHVSWTRVQPRNVTTTVMDVAERALWDVVAEQIRDQQNFDGLFGLLGEMRDAIRALLVHSERHVVNLNEYFDVDFIKQQADHGVLSVHDVCNLMNYIVTVIVPMHAPVDDGDAQRWKRETEAVISTADHYDIVSFSHDKLIPFLMATMQRLRNIYKRVVEFGERVEDGTQQSSTSD